MSDTKSEQEQEPRMIVYRGWLDRGKHVWSPFVAKVEARLRFAGVSYVTEAGSIRTAPKGKIPYVECRGLRPSNLDDSPPLDATLGDSTLIIKHLIKCDVLPDINAKLSPTAKIQDMGIRALLEDKLYFYHTWERWMQNYSPMREHALSTLPYPLRVVIGFLIYRNTTKYLHGQGTSRYTPDEIRSFRHEIWEAISDLLMSAKAAANLGVRRSPFWALGGDHPTEADATLFAFIVSVLICTACPESQRLVKGFPVVVEYAGRIHDRYFPDYEKWEG